MAVDTFVTNPEDIEALSEVEDFLTRLDIFERERQCESGILLIQRRQFPSLYKIVSTARAEELLTRPVHDSPRTPEWGVKFYPRSYFEDLKKKLSTY